MDISNQGSIQLVFVDLHERTVTVYRSAKSTLGERPGQQLMAFIANLSIPKEGESEWSLVDHIEEGTLEYTLGTVKICQRIEKALMNDMSYSQQIESTKMA